MEDKSMREKYLPEIYSEDNAVFTADKVLDSYQAGLDKGFASGYSRGFNDAIDKIKSGKIEITGK